MSALAPPSTDHGSSLEAMLRHGSALERSGHWDAADRLYADTFARAVAERRPDAMTDALRRQADVRRFLRDGDDGEELARLSLEIAERHGLAAAAARALNVVACIRYARSDFEAARTYFEAALARARTVRDSHLVGLACQNLGVLANIRGELLEARSLYLESIASSLRSGDRTAAMLVYHNLGLVCGDLGDWLEAELYFDRGIDLAERAGHLPLLAILHVNRAEPLIQLSEFARARRSLARAAELAEQLHDGEVRAGVERFAGVIARLEGDLPQAQRHLEAARARATEAGAELELAEATAGLATVRGLRGADAEERSLLEEALAAFRRMGAVREAGRVEARLHAMDDPDATADADPRLNPLTGPASSSA
jgi:tetratricopeptide (TPR) repeat protein